MHTLEKDPVIENLVNLGERHPSIRAMVLTSSRCSPVAPVDIFSDYDVEIFAEDPVWFVKCDEWIHSLGPVMATWKDEWGENEDHRWMRMVVYQDGTKMDIQIGYVDSLRKIAQADSLPSGYDIGFKVILDKDGITDGIKSPTYKAYIVTPPSEERYMARLEAFWMDTTYVAKFLWRDDIMAAKTILHDIANNDLRELLEWSIGIDRNWNWKAGILGRGIKKALDPDTYAELIASYAGGNEDDIWESLSRTVALCRKTAIKVADALGFSYPYDLDRRVSIYHQTVRNLDRNTTDHNELAQALSRRYKEEPK